MTPLLEARGLGFVRGGRALVDAVSLVFAPGELAVVVGPNGAGKSTLLRLLSGWLRPSRGEVLVEGAPIASLPAWRLACRRAFMPQGSSTPFPFTAFEVARLGVEGLGRGLAAARREAIVAAALARADAAPLAGRLFQTLSGGERQRVHFARVLAQIAAGRTVEARQMLFLDEPIANLDLKHQLALLAEARRLAGDGVAVVAVLHDLQLAAERADRVILLADGRVVADASPGEALRRELVERVFEVRLAEDRLPPSPWAGLAGRAATASSQA